MKRILLVLAMAAAGWTAAAEIPAEWTRARTLVGAYGDGCGAFSEGVCTIKCGKASRSGLAAVSLKVKLFNGKTVSYGATKVNVLEGGEVRAVWPRRPYAVTFYGDGTYFGEPVYEGLRPCCTPDAVWSASVGGDVSGMHALELPYWYDSSYSDLSDLAAVDGTGWAEYDLLYVMGGVYRAKMGGMCVSSNVNCAYHPFTASGARWSFLTTKPSHWTGEQVERYVPKISYNAKSGLFKGTYKVVVGPYCLAIEKGEAAPREKTVTLKFNGACVDGRFQGCATYKGFSTPIVGE